MDKDHQQSEFEYMPPVVAASQRRARKFAPIMLLVIFSFFVFFLIWAALAEIDEVTRGEGKVIPSGQNKMIDHLEGGIVKKIYVREGDTVRQGQVLLLIDNTVAEARYKEGREHYFRTLATVARLKAQIDGEEYEVPKVVQEKAPRVAEQSKGAYKSWQEKLKNEKAIATQDIEQRKQELAELQANLGQYEEQYKLSKEELDLTAPLVKQGVVAKVEFIRQKRDLVDVKGKVAVTKESVKRIEAALEQAKKRVTQVEIAQKNDDLKDLENAKTQMSEAQKLFTTEGDRVTRTEVRSPVRGTVKELLVNTVGGVVQPGEDLISITPLEESLLVEAQIRPADIAFLRKGLKAIVKISAYDFAVYGGLDAELENIGADTVVDEEGNSFYKIKVRTKKNSLERNGEVLNIIPGMVATVDILTGKKTVLDYLLKPLMRAKDTALRER